MTWRETIGTHTAAAAAAAGAPQGTTPLASAILKGGNEGLNLKYPSWLHVTYGVKPRPGAAVVVTNPATGARPLLPAGYGSGFEIGTLCVCVVL